MKAIDFWKKYWFVLFVVFMGFASIYDRTPDPDAYFLVSTGRYIWETGTVPSINPFTVADNVGMTVQQPLACVVNYLFYQAFGFFGLFLQGCVSYALFLFIGWRYIRLHVKDSNTAVLLLCGAALAVVDLFASRPSGITLCVFMVLLSVLERYRRTGLWRWLACLPAISVFLINWQAAMWPFLFILSACYLVPASLAEFRDARNAWRERARMLLSFLSFAFFFGFLNPSGSRAVVYLLDSYGTAAGALNIMELSAPGILSKSGLLILASLAGCALLIMRRRDRADWAALSMGFGTALMAAMHLRNFWFVLLALPMLWGGVLDSFGFRLDLKLPERDRRRMGLGVLAGGIVITAVLLGERIALPLTEDALPYACVHAADYLDEYDGDVVLFAGFNTGAYMEFRGYKIYMDARPELYAPGITQGPDIYGEYLSVLGRETPYADFISKYGFTHLLIGRNQEDSFQTWALCQDWLEPVAKDRSGILFEVR